MLRTLALASACCVWLSAPAVSQEPSSNTELANAISAAMQAHHFDPSTLSDPAYAALDAQMHDLALEAADREAFVTGFNALWRDGPFSHVNLAPAQAPATDFAAFLDTMNVGGGGARLELREDGAAILTVSTMMGNDTIEEINAAYQTIAEQGAERLIIDLRGNSGGAFAVRPLVSHVISEPLDAGAFISQPWAARFDRAPSLADAEAFPPWEGWSIRAFWADVQSAPLTRLQFQPSPSPFTGQVCVLVGSDTASAAELAADALKASGRAVLIGETTAGQMLSQAPFDVAEGLHLFLPVADYYSFSHGRIEGEGVSPHIAAPASDAMSVALSPEGPCVG